MEKCKYTMVSCSDDQRLNLLFKTAFRFVELGKNTLIMSKYINNLDGLDDQDLYRAKPDLLTKIRFRYFEHFADVISGCHNFHERMELPDVIIFNGLEDFCEPERIEAMFLCASLKDIFESIKRPPLPENSEFHVVLIVKDATFEKSPECLVLFDHHLSYSQMISWLNKLKD